MAVDDTAKSRRISFGTDGIRERQWPPAPPDVWRGRNHAPIRRTMRKKASTQKQRRVGHGPYSVKAPPKSKAAAKPIACAAMVIAAALLARSGLLHSKIAAVDGLAARPTPLPISARPANTQYTSGATANKRAPTSEANRPTNIVARRPIWSEMPPKPTNITTTASG